MCTQTITGLDMYMEAPKGFTFDAKGNTTAKDYVLQIKHHYYDQIREQNCEVDASFKN